MNSSILEIVTAEIFLPCKRELIQLLDIDAESIENDEDGFNSDVSLDFHQCICDYLPVIILYSGLLLITVCKCVRCFFFSLINFISKF